MDETAILNVKNIFMRELDDRNYNYEYHAIDKIFNTWLERKAMLINILSKHPNWDTNHFMVHFDEDFTRNIELEKANSFLNWLKSETNIEDIKFKTMIGETPFQWTHTVELINEMYGLAASQYIPDDYNLEYINQFNEDWRFRPGMKTTKVIGQICKTYGWDKLPDYNKEYAKFCDALSPIKVTRHTCLSVNPVDYLLMSHGNSWKSCHYIGDSHHQAGCYSSGTISYMLDEHSMIFYTVGADFDDINIETEPKIQRQVFGYNDFQITQSRLYPQSNDYGAKDIYTEIRNIVQKVIADCLEKPNLWIKRKVTNTEEGDHSTCYHDWAGGSSLYSTSVLKEKAEMVDLEPIVFGAAPICIQCGSSHSTTGNINCCNNGYTCAHCGHSVYADDIVFIDGEPYCPDCVYWCEWCDEYHLESEGEYVYDAGCWVCYDCLENSGDYMRCGICGEWHRDDRIHHVESDGKWVCDNCIDWYYKKCDECGEYFKRDQMKQVTNPEFGFIDFYCHDCYKEKFESENENKENE